MKEMQDSVFVKEQEHTKCNLLDIALYAGSSLISEGSPRLEITGDMMSTEQPQTPCTKPQFLDTT